MINGLSLIHVQFLLVWGNNSWILLRSSQWINLLLLNSPVDGLCLSSSVKHPDVEEHIPQ